MHSIELLCVLGSDAGLRGALQGLGHEVPLAVNDARQRQPIGPDLAVSLTESPDFRPAATG